MLFLLWVPSAQHAVEIEASIASLWPDAPLEIRVGERDGDGVAWDGETLQWVRGEAEAEADSVDTAEEAIVLARSWLREPHHDLGWIPSPPAVPASGELDLELPPPERRSTARGYVGLGVGERIEIAGVPDAMRMQGGVRLDWFSVGATLSVPIPRGRRRPGTVEVSGTAFAVHLVANLWPRPLVLGTWTAAPVGIVGPGVRQVAMRELDPRTGEMVPIPSWIDVGPELGLGLQVIGPSWGIRTEVVDRMGFADTFRHHAVISIQMLVLM